MSLTDEPGKGTVTLGAHVERGEISRQDVAAVLDAVLHEPALGRRVFQATVGDTPIEDALQEIVDLPKPVHQ